MIIYYNTGRYRLERYKSYGLQRDRNNIIRYVEVVGIVEAVDRNGFATAPVVYGIYFFVGKRHTIDLRGAVVVLRRRSNTRVYILRAYGVVAGLYSCSCCCTHGEKLVSIKAAAAASYRFGPREVEVTGVGSYY